MDDNCDIPRVDVPADFSGPGYYNNPSIESSDGKEVVGCGEYLVFGPKSQKEERAANVCLLRSAPDLYAALEAAAELAEGTVKLLRQLDMESGRIAAECVLRDARAALAKATATK